MFLTTEARMSGTGLIAHSGTTNRGEDNTRAGRSTGVRLNLSHCAQRSRDYSLGHGQTSEARH
jgi:hypothetical protein